VLEAFFPITAILLVSSALAMSIQSRFPPREGRLLLASFALHVVFVGLNAYMIKVIYGRGDPVAFVNQGAMVHEDLLNDPTLLPEVLKMVLGMSFELPSDIHGGKGSTYTMFGLAALGELFVGTNFFAVHMLYGMLGYFAKVALYTAFRDWAPKQQRPWMLVAACFIPSVVFWSAGIIKESLVLDGLALTMFGAWQVSRKRPMGLLVGGAGVYLVMLIKPFYLLLLVAGAAVQVWWYRSVKNGRVTIKPASLVAGILLGALGLSAIGYVFPKYSLANLGAEAAAYQANGFKEGSSASYYQIGNPNDTSLTGQLRYAPLGLFTGLYRPGVWEARNPQMLVNALETLAFLVFSIRAIATAGYQGLLARLVAYPVLMFCLVFALGSAAATGLTSFNLGSLSRYRMPLLPFFVFCLVLLNHKLPARRRVVRTRTTKRRPRRRR
jgi:hypothetical protein